MITNLPLGHLKISLENRQNFLAFVENCINEKRKSYCIPLNLTKYVMSKNDYKLRRVINSADLIISDGISMLWLSRRLGYRGIVRVPGIELAESIISLSREKNWKIYFFGATFENLALALEKIRRKFNEPIIVGSRHGYFKKKDINYIISSINKTNADILILGLGLPQKEYFIHDYYQEIKVRFCLPVGGAFDIWAEKKTRSPSLLQHAGLEWTYRSFFDGSRAYLVAKYGLRFLKDLLFLPFS